MRPRNFAFWLGSVAIAGLFGTASTAQPVPKGETAPCFGQSCPIQPVAKAPTESEAGAPDKPYDWKESFAAYKVGEVSRTADGKPDLQGIWSRSILTPLERPGSESDKGNMIHQSGASSRMLRSKGNSTFAPNPPLLRRVKKPRMLTT